MHCRTFLDNHLAFLDLTLSEGEQEAMQVHLAECARCARRDTALRRGLMVLRNLPSIEPSPEFRARLDASLRAAGRVPPSRTMGRRFGVGSLAAAAGVAAVALLATSLLIGPRAPRTIVMPPVLAMRPALAPSLVNQGFVASISAGVPVWTAAVMAEQAPVHFASMEMDLSPVSAR